MRSCASRRPAPIRGARVPPRWNGRCRRRRRSTSSKCCRGYSNQGTRRRTAPRLFLDKRDQILLVVDHNAIELSPRISEADVADYVALLKPRVMSLGIFTPLFGLGLWPGHCPRVAGFASRLGFAVGGGASGGLNMALEGDIDAKMTRTANRPIPRGRITPPEAMTFGLTLAFFAVMTLGILVNWIAGALLAFTIFFYVVIYTMALKRRTAQNTVIGGPAAALPPAVPWPAAPGSPP